MSSFYQIAKDARDAYKAFAFRCEVAEDVSWTGYVVRNTGDLSRVTYFDSVGGYEVVWVSEASCASEQDAIDQAKIVVLKYALSQRDFVAQYAKLRDSYIQKFVDERDAAEGKPALSPNDLAKMTKSAEMRDSVLQEVMQERRKAQAV